MGLLDRFRRPDEGGDKPPKEKPPTGASGRGHSNGFIQAEEFNTDLIHPAGQTIFDKMYRTDADIRQVVSLIINPLVGGTWGVEAYGGEDAAEEDLKIAEFVRWALWDAMRPNLLGHLIEFLPVVVRGGFAIGEKVWMSAEYEGKTLLVPRTIGLRLPRTIEQFEQDEYGQLTRVKQQLQAPMNALTAREDGTGGKGTGDDAVWLERRDFVYYRVGGEGDNWEGVSLLRPAYKHWLFKDKIERIDAIAQEREALGIPICYPPAGATSEQLDAVEDILQAMRANEEGYVLAPGPKAGSGMSNEGTGWLFEILGYDRTGSGRDPMPSLNYHTQKIMAAFVAEFMKLGHGETGARATAQVQADPFLMAVEALATVVEQALNDEIVTPLVAYNFPGVKNPPKLKMSLVDSTSLAQLADFVLKLTQIGALFPDQKLEDFLRARADLPPADPSVVKERQKDDAEIRRSVVGAQTMDEKKQEAEFGAAAKDKFGQNSKPGVSHGKGKGGAKDAAGTNPGARGGTNRGSSREADGIDPNAIILGEYVGERYRHRERRWDEMFVDLDAIEDAMDTAGGAFEAHAALTTALAREMADESQTPYGRRLLGSPARAPLEATISGLLVDAYNFGFNSVLSEAQRQNDAFGAITLSAGARARGGAIGERAALAADRVENEMREYMLGAELSHGDKVRGQEAAERAAKQALRRIGHDHGVAAMLHGRHDAGAWLASDESPFQVVGVRYSAILDANTCESCREADDGQVRDLDDPVRLRRMPPNPDCHSTASGHNRCRCFETYEVMQPTPPTNLNAVTLPDFVIRVATELNRRGMSEDRAAGAAMQIARYYCRTGKLLWPGLAGLGLSREAACAAIGVS